MAKMMSSAPIVDRSLYEDMAEYQKPPPTKSSGSDFFLSFGGDHKAVKQENNQNLLLSSPDVSRAFPLSTPEVETLLSTCCSTATTNVLTPTSFLQRGTNDQDMYARSFFEALEQFNNSSRDGEGIAVPGSAMAPPTSSSSSGKGSTSNLNAIGCSPSPSPSSSSCSSSAHLPGTSSIDSIIQHPIISSTCDNQFLAPQQPQHAAQLPNNSLALMAPTYVNRTLAHFNTQAEPSNSSFSSSAVAAAGHDQPSFATSSYAHAMFNTPAPHHPHHSMAHHQAVLDSYATAATGGFCIGAPPPSSVTVNSHHVPASRGPGPVPPGPTVGGILHPPQQQQHLHQSFAAAGGHVNPEFIRELQSMVPTDMETMEQLKQERKKARNRMAAFKCRVRRLQRESELQVKVKSLKQHNQELNEEVNKLKDEILNLKRALVSHQKKGCRVHIPPEFCEILGSLLEC